MPVWGRNALLPSRTNRTWSQAARTRRKRLSGIRLTCWDSRACVGLAGFIRCSLPYLAESSLTDGPQTTLQGANPRPISEDFSRLTVAPDHVRLAHVMTASRIAIAAFVGFSTIGA